MPSAAVLRWEFQHELFVSPYLFPRPWEALDLFGPPPDDEAVLRVGADGVVLGWVASVNIEPPQSDAAPEEMKP